MSGAIQIVGKTTSGVAKLVPVDSSGNLQMVVGSALPTGGNAIGKLAANSGVDIGDVDVLTCGTITPGTAATSLGKAIGSAGGATDTGVAALVIRDDTLSTLADAEGDYVALRVNSTGALHTTTTLSVTSAALESDTDVANSTTETTNSIDLNTAKRLVIFGSLTDTTGEIKIEYSNDNSTYFTNTEDAIFINSSGHFSKTLNVEARYIRFKYTNGSGSSATWNLNYSFKS